MKIRTFFAVLLCKLARGLLRLLRFSTAGLLRLRDLRGKERCIFDRLAADALGLGEELLALEGAVGFDLNAFM